MKLYISWALWCVLAFAVLTVFQLILKNKIKKLSVRFVLISVKLLISVAFAVLVLAGPVFLRPFQPFMFAFYAVCFADAVSDLCCTLFCAFAKKERKFLFSKVLSLIFGVLFIAYGTINMEVVRPKYHTYTSEKLTSEHSFAYLADLHVGSAQNFSTTEKTISEIKKLNVDFIVLCGDITDDYTTKEEMQKTFALFKDCNKPVYYVYGNHDRQGYAEYAHGRQYSIEELEQTINSCGIRILKDEYEEISPDLIILGREDYSEKEGRADISTLPDPKPESYLIVADHQPSGFKEHVSAGADLQISGHTHAGQLFPLRVFYSIAAPVYGDYKEQGAVMNITSGACGWRVPFRTEAHCNYEIINLKPVE